jgi:hypothetical protein
MSERRAQGNSADELLRIFIESHEVNGNQAQQTLTSLDVI